MALTLEITSKKAKKIYNVLSHMGKITIGDYSESVYIPLDYWTVDEYKQQWKEGLERIKTHDTSCLIVTIHDPKIRRFIEWWSLYKVGDTVYVRNNMFTDFVYENRFGKTIVTRENCYDFISPRRTKTDDGDEISEWSVPLSDI